MSLLLKLFKKKSKEVSMTVLGLDGVGKTTLVNYLLYGEFKPTIPTMGMNVNSIRLPKIELLIHDLGGQLYFRSLWSKVNERSDAIVFVVDSSAKERMEETKIIFDEVINTQLNQNIPVLILLNKVDLPNRISRIDFINYFELSSLLKNFNWSCFETSAKTGKGLIEAFSFFLDMLEDAC